MTTEYSNDVEFSRVSIDELIPYARNSRKHSPEQIAQIAASIREFGFLAPVVVADDNTILAGHGRVLAAQKLGMQAIPCVKATSLTEAQRRAYVLVDNRLSDTSSWDADILKNELQDLNLNFPDLALDEMGFSEPELNDMQLGMNLNQSDESVSGDIVEGKSIDGSRELDESEFSDFECKCPRCGFEFDKGAK